MKKLLGWTILALMAIGFISFIVITSGWEVLLIIVLVLMFCTAIAKIAVEAIILITEE